MASGWKRSITRLLLLVHLFLLPASVLWLGDGFVALTHHRHQGVLYELTSLLAPRAWHGLSWHGRHALGPQHSPQYPLDTGGFIYNSVRDSEHPALTEQLLFVLRGTLEENLRLFQSLEMIDSLVWVEGISRSGNKEPTLIAQGTAELEGRWIYTGPEYWGQPPSHFYGTALFSQRIYNLGRLWWVFYSLRDLSDKEVLPSGNGYVSSWMRPQYGTRILGITDQLTSTDVLQRMRFYRPGVIPVGDRFRILKANPVDDWWWRPLVPRAWDTPFTISVVVLYIITIPYRYLFYLPLVLAPRLLVWPVALLWAALILASWWWSAAFYRRLLYIERL